MHEYQVYVATLLEMGANEALERYEERIMKAAEEVRFTINVISTYRLMFTCTGIARKASQTPCRTLSDISNKRHSICTKYT